MAAGGGGGRAASCLFPPISTWVASIYDNPDKDAYVQEGNRLFITNLQAKRCSCTYEF